MSDRHDEDAPDSPEALTGELVPSPTPASRRALPPIPPVKLSRAARHRVDDALTTLESTLGGRDGMVDALALGTHGALPPDRAQFILGMLADPRYRGKSLRQLAKLAGISLQDLLTLYQDSTVMRAHLASITTIAAGLPAVAADVMAKSVPYEEDCYTCGGVGEVTAEPTKKQPNPAPETCRTCRGGGRLKHQPDLERQKLALSLGGLLKGGAGGLTVNVTQQQAQAPAQVPFTGGEALIQLQKMSEQALYGGGTHGGRSKSPARGGAGSSGGDSDVEEG